MTTVSHARPCGRFIEIQSNFKRQKLHKTKLNPNFLEGSFSNILSFQRTFILGVSALAAGTYPFLQHMLHIHVVTGAAGQTSQQNSMQARIVDLQRLRAPSKKLRRTNQGSNFLRGSFSNRGIVRSLIHFRRERRSQHIMR